MAKSRRRPPVKIGGFILSDQIRIGDVVRITTVSGDMVSSNTGEVAKRSSVGQGIGFYTAQGQLLGVDWRNHVDLFRARLIRNAKIYDDLPLEGFDALTEFAHGNPDTA